jgi:hypothetical protein
MLPLKEGQMAEYFQGVKWLVTAHYPKAADRVQESHNVYSDAVASKDRHVSDGANVDISRHYWSEQIIGSGWYPARAKS